MPEAELSLETIEHAQRLLSKVSGGSVQLDKGKDLGGSNRTEVYRFQVLAGPEAIPATVIVKRAHSLSSTPYNPGLPVRITGETKGRTCTWLKQVGKQPLQDLWSRRSPGCRIPANSFRNSQAFHLMVQPTGAVSGIGTCLPARIASSASRA